jgi:NADH:ubiquinone oxidoreductase subunit 3 (subunit A)
MKPPLTDAQIARKKKVARIVSTVQIVLFFVVGLVPLFLWIFYPSFRHIPLIKVIAWTVFSLGMATWIYYAWRTNK